MIAAMILVIDNYDSFAHNLARYMALSGWRYEVVRNDALDLDDIETIKPEAIVISPGPSRPKDAGVCLDLIKRYGSKIPMLGVCLGHQCIGEAYGSKIVESHAPTHGKSSHITHNDSALFKGLPNPMEVGRYHSLIIDHDYNSDLIITATDDDDTVMAIEHRMHPVYGVQFHPESVLTKDGLKIIMNFTDIAQAWNDRKYYGDA